MQCNLCTVLKSAGFEKSIDSDHSVVEDDSRYSLTYKKKDSSISLKITERERNKPTLDSGKRETSDILVPSNVLIKYFDLFDNLTVLLQFEEICEALNSLMACESHHITLFCTNFIKCLKDCTDTVMQLRSLLPYSNWYDHSIIRQLLNACNCLEGLRLLNEFDAQIDFSLSIKDYPLPTYHSSYMTPDVSGSHTVLAIRCEQQISALSLQHIGMVKAVILQTFDITDHACILLTATNYTSAIFYWLIPKNIVALIYSKVLEHAAHLYDNKILELAIYPNFTFSTGDVSRIWSLSYSSDTAVILRDVRKFQDIASYIAIVHICNVHE